MFLTKPKIGADMFSIVFQATFIQKTISGCSEMLFHSSGEK
jgi:hypothetical protein